MTLQPSRAFGVGPRPRQGIPRKAERCLSLDSRASRLALHLLERHSLGRKGIGDALLAATLLRHGVNSIMTCNPCNFAVFNDLEVIDPRNANEPRGVGQHG